MRTVTTNRNRQRTIPRPNRLALAIPLSLLIALALSACENVASFSQPAAIRVIDASAIAPAANFAVEGQLIAANLGSGIISSYGTLAPSSAAPIDMTATISGAALLTGASPLIAGNQYSIFVSDSVGTQTAYVMTVLQDQQIPAPIGRSAFRFINQAALTGAVDIYMVPASAVNAVPLLTALPVGGPLSYISFPAQSVTMVVTPTGVASPAFISSTIPLIGGEARTVLIMDSKLTANPPFTVTMADDAGPAN